ncbi:MAG: cyclic pyranopterin monophosphate synthase MoaC [Longimicrobiales bacterium]
MSEDPDGLSHQDAERRARMVDVGHKAATRRVAVAEGRIVLAAATFRALVAGSTPKGDPLLIARIAGIQAGKRTAELIPLCHPIALDRLDLELELEPGASAVRAVATASAKARTGVEMEALTAVGIALLTLYDMLKGIERGMRIDGIRLLSKSGGTGGDWTVIAPDQPDEHHSTRLE